MRISEWSSDVCSSDLKRIRRVRALCPEPLDSHPDAQQRTRAHHNGRIFGAQGLCPPSENPAIARQAHGTGPWARVRSIRPQPGCTNLASAQTGRTEYVQTRFHKNRLGRSEEHLVGQELVSKCRSWGW